jgi:ferric-dicitrate binding protein FerR (iron transport regulator)
MHNSPDAVTDSADDWTRIARYLEARSSEALSPDQEAAFREWLHADSARREKWAVAKLLWTEGADAFDSMTVEMPDSEAAWTEVAARLDLPSDSESEHVGTDARPDARLDRGRTRPRRSRHRSVGRRAVFAVLVLVGAVIAVYVWGRRGPDAEPRIVRTAPGERDTVRLADGSVVTLAPDTRVRIPSAFLGKDRRVHLRGRAFFEVAADSTRPFRVRTQEATTEVLGTVFSVEAYPDDSQTRVVVAEGRVSVRDDSSGAQAVVASRHVATAGNGRVETAIVSDLAAELSWRKGRLVFQQEPLPSVLRSLERWYGVDFAAPPASLADRRLTATFHDESVSQALEVLRLTLGVSINRTDVIFVVPPRN